MKKKIFSIITIAVAALIPLKVNAAESCTTKTNYYLFHEALSQFDTEVTTICGEETNLNTCIGSHPNTTVTYSSKDINAYFNNNIPSTAKNVVGQYYTLSNGGETSDVKTINGFHYIWGKMLNSGNTKYNITDESDANIQYFLHTSWSKAGEDVPENRPFFTINTNFANNANTIMGDVRNSYLIGDQNKSIINGNEIKNSIYDGDNKLKMTIRRSYSFLLNSYANKINMCTYTSGCRTGAPGYYLIHPSVYEIKYDVCENEYTITYDANGGENAPSTQTKSEGVNINLSDQKPTRSGSTFLGWSTNKDATQADSTYNPGAVYSADQDLTLWAVWLNDGKGTTTNSKTGIGYSLGIIGAVLATTGGGIAYFKKRNKFENI